ncbi:MAG: hypothetical protein FJ087_18270 [Deltaproteobacteria bacterium]|nr:hypothetical protein [Deltaproteobacteria bacterium]
MADRDPLDSTAERAREVSAARLRLVTRAVIAASVIAVGAWVVVTRSWPGIAYFLEHPDLVSYGDVRELRAKGTKALDARTNSFVRLENLVVTNRAETSRYNYFWCPVFDVLVRTAAPLPPIPVPSGRIYEAEIPAGLEFLVEQRKVFPEDLSVRFDAQGRLVRLRDAPGWSGPVGQYARDVLRLADAEADAAWALLDGESPRLRGADVGFLLAALVVAGFALTALFLAWRAYRRLGAR